MKTYSCNDVDLPHEDLIALREAGHLNLGMDNSLAATVSNNPESGPANKTSSAAFHFWSWVAIGVFGYSVYLSFTDAWWWFIPGLVLMSAIWKANKKGNTENLLEAAFSDKDFYERVRMANGWIYQIEETKAAKYLKSSG